MTTLPVRRRTIGATLTLVLGIAFGLRAEPVEVTLLHINDWDRMEEADGRGGFARLAAIVEAERAARPHVLLLHAGDAISPSLLSGFDRGAHMIDLLNRLDLDAFTLGNHEFDFGPEVLAERLAEASFPIVNSNVRDATGAVLPGTHETLTIEVAGVTFGLLGLTTPDTVALSNPGDTVFLPSLETALRVAAELRVAGADLVVALAHTGLEEDVALLRQRVVDLLMTGHDHHLLTFWDGRVAMVESGAQVDHVIAVDLVIDRDGDRVSFEPRFRTLDSADYQPLPEAEAVVAAHLARLSEEIDVEIGILAAPLDTREAVVRSGEAAIGNLVADVMRATVGADAAITNGGGIRGERIHEAGTVLLRRDVHTMLPFANHTVKLEVDGATILAALENGLSRVETGAGRFPQVSGMTVRWAPSKPAGSRVVDVAVGGEPLDPAATYTLATNDFMARGGDGYVMLEDARQLIDAPAGGLLAGRVIDHIAAVGTVAAMTEGRIMRAE